VGIVNINILVIVFEYRLMLYRYDLQKHQSYKITPTDYYIPLPISGYNDLEYIKEHGYTGLFCTTVEEYDAVRVSRSLSLTYYPEYINRIDISCIKDIELMTHNYQTILRYSSSNDLPRVWPAFNKRGGYREVLITKPDRIEPPCVSVPDTLKNVRSPDFFHQDNTQEYDRAMARVLIRAIGEALNLRRLEFRDIEFLLFRSRGNTTSVTVPSVTKPSVTVRKGENRKIALSAAYKSYPNRTIIGLWSALYEDDEKCFERRIFGPFSTRLTFELQRCSILTPDGTLGGNLKYIVEAIGRLLEASLDINDAMFYRGAHAYLLPP
jgi:hypothetical protein